MRVLLVTSRYPWPARRGDQLRAVQHLEHLAPRHEVTLLTPEPPSGQVAPGKPPAGTVIHTYRVRRREVLTGLWRVVGRGLPFQNALFSSTELRRKLRELAPEVDLVILQLVRLAECVEELGPVPWMVDFIDSLSLNLASRARCDRLWLRPLLLWEARRLGRWEVRLGELASGALAVCGRDADEIGRRLGDAAARRVRVVGVAVDPDHARPRVSVPSSAAGPPTLALTGNLGYFPNRHAVRWWLRQVWPRLRRCRPDVRLVVAGDRPGRGLRETVRRAGAELVVAPADLRRVLAGATLALAPLRCGSGIPVKILEAWSVNVPVVASLWAAEGASARPGHDLAVASTPEEWVATLRRLLDDPDARERLAQGGRRSLLAHYGDAVVKGQLLDAVESAAWYGPGQRAGGEGDSKVMAKTPKSMSTHRGH